MSNFQKRAQEIADDIVTLLAKKNHDYGDSFSKQYQEYGMTSALIRFDDKLSRLKSLTIHGNEQQVKDESIKDTVKDIVGYGILTLMELEKGEGK